MIAILQSYSTMLLGALGKTLLLTLLSLLFAMIIGMIFALMNVGRSRVLNCIGTVYVDAVRGVPLIVLAYFIYFGVPSGMKMMGATDFRLSALQAGTIALAMNCGAYMAEIIRAGIQSVDKGQMEPKPWTFLCQKYASGYPAAGDPYDDSIDHQSVHHHAEGYLDPVRYRISGTYQHGQDDRRKYVQESSDLGDCRYYVHDRYHHFEQTCKEN